MRLRAPPYGHRSKLARNRPVSRPDILPSGGREVEVLRALAGDIALLGRSEIQPICRGGPGTIDVGFLVRDTVRVDGIDQRGAGEILSVDGSPLHDRPPLLLLASHVDNGAPFPVVVMVLHLRSLLGIDDASTADRVRRKRLEQAQSIALMVQEIQAAEPGARLIVLGDFNAFEFTDGYVDVVGQIRGRLEPARSLLSGPDLVDPDLADEVEHLPPGERYSFLFDGRPGTRSRAHRHTGAWIAVSRLDENADAVPLMEDDVPARLGPTASCHRRRQQRDVPETGSPDGFRSAPAEAAARPR
jgi:hypothetical protein